MTRRAVYRKDFDEQARKLCLLGATNEELGEFFGVTRQCIDTWIAKHESFREAVYGGREIADAEVARRLYDRTAEDTRACEVWLKNRRPHQWRDRREHTGPDGGPIQYEDVRQKLWQKLTGSKDGGDS